MLIVREMNAPSLASGRLMELDLRPLPTYHIPFRQPFRTIIRLIENRTPHPAHSYLLHTLFPSGSHIFTIAVFCFAGYPLPALVDFRLAPQIEHMAYAEVVDSFPALAVEFADFSAAK